MTHWMHKITVLWVCIIPFGITSLSLYGGPDYFFCIEGGGSKTILQVMNQEGEILHLMKDGIRSERIETTGSNINSVGLEGVRQVLNFLFERSFIIERDQEIDLSLLLPDSYIVAGMAGAGLPQNQQSLTALLQERGISNDRICLMSDADMALQILDREGIILIAGTGSICLGKRDQTLFRAGGLGRILGDEGSGYQIGLQALKAVLAEEYGWGISTALTPALKELFQVADLKTLIPKINLGEISPSKIASSAPLVFHCAYMQDPVAEAITDRAADDLSNLLTTMFHLLHFPSCEVHLWGGIFKHAQAEAFLQKIRERLPESYRDLKMMNKAKEHLAVLFAQRQVVRDCP